MIVGEWRKGARRSRMVKKGDPDIGMNVVK
jgi:hypothetical protein